jgi:hypothetical protein
MSPPWKSIRCAADLSIQRVAASRIPTQDSGDFLWGEIEGVILSCVWGSLHLIPGGADGWDSRVWRLYWHVQGKGC